MQKKPNRLSSALVVAGLVALLSGCGTSLNHAPVEDRTAVKPSKPAGASPSGGSASSSNADAKPLPGAENAGKPGYYTVKPGDTLIRVALENGQGWRDLVKWNGLDNPNVIEVGQVLRVVPPGVDAASVSARPINSAKVESRPLDGKAPAASAPAGGSSAASAAGGAAAASAAAAAARSDDDDISWAWPTNGPLIGSFDEARNNKGLDFSGKAGDPVLAAADGRVMYAGSGLRGYGHMVIIKHNAGYISAYAHNQALLVKEDQVVRKGQKIAEMGSSDADQVKLHFEIRRQTKLMDPAKLLPAR
ncbi:peptidase [Paucibacter sp. KBW04]|uniref:peptidoglycan DD-metalloendopeptidase family protein n=1 Tax=Paucibacter sp. KBW04 TaxID=2153361 RepID=UPI000F56D4C6|nr:peptidoglycan DD-metalloendopeptidase family protein [Paucibacter sp. KBW04]RQO55363.1 peptidase [Paucibacter sp. KBW04]